MNEKDSDQNVVESNSLLSVSDFAARRSVNIVIFLPILDRPEPVFPKNRVLDSLVPPGAVCAVHEIEREEGKPPSHPSG
jgi:hypothetical protein